MQMRRTDAEVFSSCLDYVVCAVSRVFGHLLPAVQAQTGLLLSRTRLVYAVEHFYYGE